jgi:peptidoglycan DL-endopeptidase LytF
MKMLSLSACLLMATNLLFGQNVRYLLYEEALVNRLDYAHMKGGSNMITSYTLPRPKSDELLVLGVGLESKSLKDQPKNLERAYNIADLQGLASKINAKETTLYMVRPMSGSYTITPVSSATYIRQVGDTYSLVGYSYQFDVDVANNSFSENLSLRRDSNYIFLKSREDFGCKKSFKFSYEPNKACACGEGSMIQFVSGLGFISEENSLCSTDKAANGLHLMSVNGKPVETALTELCNPSLFTNSPAVSQEQLVAVKPATAPVIYSAKTTVTAKSAKIAPPTAPVVYNTKAKASKLTGKPVQEVWIGADAQPVIEEVEQIVITNERVVVGPPAPCPNLAGPGVHIVSTGETLLSISRKYGVPLNDLQKWNNLKNANQIKTCQSIAVVAPRGVQTSVATKTTQIKKTVAPAKMPVLASKSTKKSISKLANKSNKSTKVTALATKPTNKVAAYTTESQNVTTTVTTSRIVGSEIAANQTAPVIYSNKTTVLPSTMSTKAIVLTTRNGNIVHTVTKGETLYSLSKIYGFTVERFALMNGLTPSSALSIGQQLLIKDASQPIYTESTTKQTEVIAPTTTAKTTENQVYYSQPVENTAVYAPSQANTVVTYSSTQEVQEAAIEEVPSTYYVEEVVTYSTPTKATTETVYTSTPAVQEGMTYITGMPIKTHTVTEGDTFDYLSKKYKTTPARIREWNQLADNEVLVNGQLLIVQK